MLIWGVMVEMWRCGGAVGVAQRGGKMGGGQSSHPHVCSAPRFTSERKAALAGSSRVRRGPSSTVKPFCQKVMVCS